MKNNLAWLLSVLVMAALAAVQKAGPNMQPTGNCTPKTCSIYCAGNHHANKYCYPTTFPEYTAESSTLDHP